MDDGLFVGQGEVKLMMVGIEDIRLKLQDIDGPVQLLDLGRDPVQGILEPLELEEVGKLFFLHL
jgi:hypothetical protein